MILGLQPQITQMTPQQPVLGGQPIPPSPYAAAQPLPASPPPTDLTSGLNMQALASILAKQQSKNQQNTPAQSFSGMLNAGATPAQAAQVVQAPNGNTGDYAAGYTGPGAAPPGAMENLYGMLASMFGEGSGAGASSGSGQ